MKDALDRGVEQFGWPERVARAGKRAGSKVRGVGVAVGPHAAGSIGFDGLMTLRPDGYLHVQSGVGNLGTHSLIDLARVAAEVLDLPWEKVVVNWGDTSKGLPWTCLSVGSQTTHAMTRANHAGAMDLKRKLQEIAARDLGGSPDDYDRRRARVPQVESLQRTHLRPRRRTRDRARRRVRRPRTAADIHAVTKAAAALHVGQGVMGVAKDNYPRDGDTYSFVAGFAEVEVDVETGE